MCKCDKYGNVKMSHTSFDNDFILMVTKANTETIPSINPPPNLPLVELLLIAPLCWLRHFEIQLFFM